MGGKVFSTGADALSTPPMKQPVYTQVKNQCTTVLKNLGFSRIETPIEAPEKNSFGDVDILASLEGTKFPHIDQFDKSKWDEIEKALKAKRSQPQLRVGPNKQLIIDSMSFAVPWPAGLGRAGDIKAAPGPHFVQVDIRLCETHQELNWRVL